MAGARRGLKVAIIGSGPSGFYSAARLLAQTTAEVEVHMYERLPTPHGLVRYGVAPDHPEVKNVENKFSQVAADKRFRFFGNVNIVGAGSTTSSERLLGDKYAPYAYPLATRLPISSLLPHYTHVLLSYGSSRSRSLGIPGSEPGDLFNVHPALDFVNWYNGHPAAHDPEYLAQCPWKRISLSGLTQATVVGAGNVALDVARILLRSSSTLHHLFQKDQEVKARAALRETDIPESVLAEFSKSDICHVDLVARRGPAEVAFTNKELREMMELQDVHYGGVSDDDIHLAKSRIAEMERRSREREEGEEDPAVLSNIRVRKRLLSILEKGSKATAESSVHWSTSFFQSPRTFFGDKDSDGKKAVKGIEWDVMAFEGAPNSKEQPQPWSVSTSTSSSQTQVRKTGQVKSTSTDLVITSVGYLGAPLEGRNPILSNSDLLLWDAKKGVISNRRGRVLSGEGKPVPGLYVSGWLASGPIGVIASTRIDANSVVEQMLDDWQESPEHSSLTTTPEPDEPTALRQASHPVISWADWLRLDAEELRRGKNRGKLREKILSVREMLDIAA